MPTQLEIEAEHGLLVAPQEAYRRFRMHAGQALEPAHVFHATELDVGHRHGDEDHLRRSALLANLRMTCVVSARCTSRACTQRFVLSVKDEEGEERNEEEEDRGGRERGQGRKSKRTGEEEKENRAGREREQKRKKKRTREEEKENRGGREREQGRKRKRTEEEEKELSTNSEIFSQRLVRLGSSRLRSSDSVL